MDLSVDIAGLRLDHPVLNASGTFDAITARGTFGDALLDDFPFSAFVSKTITPEPRDGNAPPRIFETPSGMINSIGLPNKGLEGFLEQDLPELSRLPVPLIVSVMGTSHEHFRRLVEGVADRPEVAGLELNVSCPNVESGLIVGQQPDETQALLEAVRPLTSKPLIVKLTPNVAEPETVAAAAQAGGADAVSLINTLEASAVDPGTLQPWLGGPGGGLSGAGHQGPRARPGAPGRQRGSIPVIGMGGIESGAQALAFMVAGAVAIAVGTANFRDPMAGSRIRAELSDALATAPPTSVRSSAGDGGVDLNLRSKRICGERGRLPFSPRRSGYMIAAARWPPPSTPPPLFPSAPTSSGCGR